MKKISWVWLSLPVGLLVNVELMITLLKSISTTALSSEESLHILGIEIFAVIAISAIIIIFIIVYNLIAHAVNKRKEDK